MSEQDIAPVVLTREQVRQLVFILNQVLDEGGLLPRDVRVIQHLEKVLADTLADVRTKEDAVV